MESEENALPGDLIVYYGHVGILNNEGRVISATRGGNRNRSNLDPSNKDFIPSITINDKKIFGRIKGVLKWNCK